MLSDEAGGFRHGIGISTIDLDADGPLDSLELGAFQRSSDAPANGL
jgi:hypothetical protein